MELSNSNEARKQNILIPAEEIGNNIDLLTEILLRLQVKPLVRFKSVSKQWLSLISNPQFCVSHTRHHHTPYPTPTALLLKNHYTFTSQFQIIPVKHDTISKVPFFDYLNSPCVHIKQSCNGLLLCSLQEFGMEYKHLCSYYICNPTTKHLKRLSFPNLEFKVSLVSICIAFDPLKSNYYKLICVREVKSNENYQIVMYSSETDSWSPLGITFTLLDDLYDAEPVYCNGIVHWYIHYEVETSLYFDVDRECLKTMPVPNLAQRQVLYFGESWGHLHLIVTEWPADLQFDVLEMVPDYSGWFVRYHVNLDAMRIAYHNLVWYGKGNQEFSVLHVIQAQKEEDSIVVIYVGDKAISYNVHDGTFQKLYDLESSVTHSTYHSWYDTFQYFEILTSV